MVYWHNQCMIQYLDVEAIDYNEQDEGICSVVISWKKFICTWRCCVLFQSLLWNETLWWQQSVLATFLCEPVRKRRNVQINQQEKIRWNEMSWDVAPKCNKELESKRFVLFHNFLHQFFLQIEFQPNQVLQLTYYQILIRRRLSFLKILNKSIEKTTFVQWK